MKLWYSGSQGNQCAPHHIPGSQPVCVLLTDRQLCKRGKLKVALSPEPLEIHTDTPISSAARWPAHLLIIEATSCNNKNGPLLNFRELR